MAKQLDIFEQYALRNVFAVSDSLVFLDGFEPNEAVIENMVAEPFAEIDTLLQDVISREHLNAHLRQQIVQLEATIADFLATNQRLSAAPRHNDTPNLIQNLIQHADEMHANMLTTEAELTQQAIVLPRADTRKAPTVEDLSGAEDLMDFVNEEKS